MAKRCLLAILTLVLFSYPARAVDKGPAPFKVYRNDAYGFEFRYTKDAEIITSSGTDHAIARNAWGDGDILHINDGSPVWATISVHRVVKDQSCVCWTFNIAGDMSADCGMQDKDMDKLSNGLYVYGEGEPGHSWGVAYTTHQEHCYLIRVDGKNFKSHDDKSPTPEFDESMTRMQEVQSSFRFLDREPK